MTAQELGKRLLAEVEQSRLDEVLDLLESHDAAARISHLGQESLDQLLAAALESRRSRVTAATNSPPIIELLSLEPGGGKTHVLYKIIINAILPTEYGERQSCCVVFDLDGNFSVARLAHLVKYTVIACERARKNNALGSSDAGSYAAADIEDIVQSALQHVHILHPPSLSAMTTSVSSLSSYLFNADRHHSFERSVAFIAIDSLAAFHWQAKDEREEAVFLASSTSRSRGLPAPTVSGAQPNLPDPVQTPAVTTYAQLAAAVQATSRTLRAPVIFTNRHLARSNANEAGRAGGSYGPPTETNTHASNAFRSSMPHPWPTLPTLRLVVRRAPVRRLPEGISLQEAKRESALRQAVVQQGEFQILVNGWGMSESEAWRIRLQNGKSQLRFFIRPDEVLFMEEE